MKRLSFPNVEVVRERIGLIRSEPYRYACMAAYLLAARICEIVGKSYHYEKHYGLKGSDVYLDYYLSGGERFDAVVFDVHTAKRGGMIRKVALPLDFEPWAEELYRYVSQFGKDYAFPFTRQKVWYQVHRQFEDLTYPIEQYVVSKDGKLIKVPSHQKRFALHALRHVRTTELVEHYGFDGFNLAAYCGWTITTAQAQFGIRVPRVVARYLYLNWQGYFPKLLKRRRYEKYQVV